ncbi:MAG: lipopolysaccharide core heptose(I) kinase RfaP [Desulfuromonadales bacterium]|nr:lipopolysaccharide core heptose(I) kinase RfaP [Desulfuromonadales bacterium]
MEFVERDGVLCATDAFQDMQQAGLVHFSDFMEFPGGARIVHKRGRSVFRFEIGDRAFYLKRNRLHRTELFKQLSRGKLPPRSARQEWTSIQAVSQAGIPTVKPVAFGERIFFGIETASFTVTEELYGAHPLDELVYDKFNGPEKFHEKRALIRQLAGLARHLHGAGMNHQDFYLNHFFLGEDNELFLLDLQRVQRRACTPEYSIIKDLAQLAFSARRFPFITRSDHLRFLLAYLGESRLSRGSRRLLTRVGRKAERIARHDIKLTARRRARGEMK